MSNDHVQVNITVDNVGITRNGYGKPMIVSHKATFPDRYREYASALEVADDFDSSSPEYRAANAFFAQTPKPPLVGIGRADSDVTMQYTINVAGDGLTPANSYPYAISVQGEGFDDATASFTSSATSSAGEIHAGLVAALNAVTDKNYLAALVTALVFADATFTADATTNVITFGSPHGLGTGDGPFQVSNAGGALPAGLVAVTDYWFIKTGASTGKLASSLANAAAGTAVDITDAGTGVQTMSDTVDTKSAAGAFTVTGSAVNNWFSLSVGNKPKLSIKMSHASPGSGLTDDLNAILEDEDTWYEVHTLYNSKDYVSDVEDWAEGAERIYVWDTCDTDTILVSYSEGMTTDIGSVSYEEGYTASMGGYHHTPAEMFSAGWMGRWLPTTPGQATAKFKTLAGISTLKLTSTQKTNLRARRMNSYTREYNRPITWEGSVFSEVYKYLDVRRNVDWLTDEVRKSVFGILAGSDIVPYTPEGIAKCEGAIRGSVDLAEDQGVLADGTGAVEMPEFEDIEEADFADRNLRTAKFSGKLAGAIHKAIPINGTVTF